MSVDTQGLPQDPVPSTESSEPAISIGSVIAGGTLLINGLIMFGIQVAPEQKVYLIALLTFLAPLLAGALIRFRVWSGKSVAELVARMNAQHQITQQQLVLAKAEAAGAHSAAAAVVAGMQAQTPQPAQAPAEPAQPYTQDRTFPAPPAPAYGLLGAQQQASPSPAPRPAPAQDPWVPSTAEPDGYYRYRESELAPPPSRRQVPDEREWESAPRGYRRRHALDEGPQAGR